MVKEYLVKAYAHLVKVGRRELEMLPTDYQDPVALYLVEQYESI